MANPQPRGAAAARPVGAERESASKSNPNPEGADAALSIPRSRGFARWQRPSGRWSAVRLAGWAIQLDTHRRSTKARIAPTITGTRAGESQKSSIDDLNASGLGHVIAAGRRNGKE